MVHASRLGRQLRGLGDRELRRRAIAIEVYEPVNLVSGRDVRGVVSHFRYYAGDFMRRDDGETALALFVGPGWVPRKLGRGNCSCVHFDQHLVTTRHGAGNGFIDQSFRTTSMLAADRVHCLRCFHDDDLQNSKLSSASDEESNRNFNATAVASVRERFSSERYGRPRLLAAERQRRIVILRSFVAIFVVRDGDLSLSFHVLERPRDGTKCVTMTLPTRLEKSR